MRVKILAKEGYKMVDLNRRQAIRERCLNCSGWVRVKSLNAPSMIVRFIRSEPGKATRAPTNETRLSGNTVSGAWQGNGLKLADAFPCTVLCITSAGGGLEKPSLRLKRSTGKHFLEATPLE